MNSCSGTDASVAHRPISLFSAQYIYESSLSFISFSSRYTVFARSGLLMESITDTNWFENPSAREAMSMADFSRL